jgi:hypothetical protein
MFIPLLKNDTYKYQYFNKLSFFMGNNIKTRNSFNTSCTKQKYKGDHTINYNTHLLLMPSKL